MQGWLGSKMIWPFFHFTPTSVLETFSSGLETFISGLVTFTLGLAGGVGGGSGLNMTGGFQSAYISRVLFRADVFMFTLVVLLLSELPELLSFLIVLLFSELLELSSCSWYEEKGSNTFLLVISTAFTVLAPF